MSKQPEWPEWQTISTTDYSRLRVDTTGAWAAELDIYEEDSEGVAPGDPCPANRYTILLDRCTYIGGVLSDNQFHPDLAAWFAEDLARVADCCDLTIGDLREMLCSAEPAMLAHGYESLASYHGINNFDDYPVRLSAEEVDAQLGRAPKPYAPMS